MTHLDTRRRQFLQYAAVGTMTAALPGFVFAESTQINDEPNSTFKADVEIELTAQIAELPILPGAHTHVFTYQGKLLKGPQATLKDLPGYLGPMLNFVQGQKVRIYFYNRLSEPCITHWHGMHVPQKMDGHPMYAISQGERYVYEFEVKNPAGTNWYHAHTHEMTATQVYQGLAGLITITDEAEQKLDLPSGEYDIPLVIQDRHFTNGNQLRYVHGMRQRMTGFLGDTILINGQANNTIPVKTRAYRLRILNGSNSRIYKLGWKDGTPLTAIGTDGGLLEKPETFPYIMLAPAERVELWVDFSGRKPGTDLILQNLEYKSAIPHMGGGMRHGGGMGRMGMMAGGLAQGKPFPVVKFHITEQVTDSPRLPDKLVPIHRLTTKDLSNPGKTLSIALSMRHMSPQLNGRSFEMQDYVDSEKIPVNTLQKIRIFHDNKSMGGGMGMMMSMPHPIHLHGQQFQILSRTQNNQDNGYKTVKDGFINSGWKDTVLVMPGEDVEIIKPFADYTGLFLYHCHNLEHEDMGMMRNFYVS
ncbi:MAG: multicopper oxidase domain-containing protein [Nitrosomonas sp.]|nr:multicopper oxidase domain-containing protein [Nitrosomonas sp.]MDP1949514.1 multicopper oxidase domain-containing protein [Nitrosomonas sp.]